MSRDHAHNYFGFALCTVVHHHAALFLISLSTLKYNSYSSTLLVQLSWASILFFVLSVPPTTIIIILILTPFSMCFTIIILFALPSKVLSTIISFITFYALDSTRVHLITKNYLQFTPLCTTKGPIYKSKVELLCFSVLRMNTSAHYQQKQLIRQFVPCG